MLQKFARDTRDSTTFIFCLHILYFFNVLSAICQVLEHVIYSAENNIHLLEKFKKLCTTS